MGREARTKGTSVTCCLYACCNRFWSYVMYPTWCTLRVATTQGNALVKPSVFGKGYSCWTGGSTRVYKKDLLLLTICSRRQHKEDLLVKKDVIPSRNFLHPLATQVVVFSTTSIKVAGKEKNVCIGIKVLLYLSYAQLYLLVNFE